MSTRIYGGIPLTLMMALTVLQCGAAAGWWPVIMPFAAMLGAVSAWAVGIVLLWQIDASGRLTSLRAPQAQHASVPLRPDGSERRTTPRFALRCPIELDLHELGMRQGELQDISQGGARIAGAGHLEDGCHGVLRVAGINHPVPFIVVGQTAQAEIRVRFELSGLGLETFIRQLGRLVAGSQRLQPSTAC